MKKNCCKCGTKIAVWTYMPMHEGDDMDYCDNCVPRGCSCNIDPNTGIEDTDDKGRFYPCCEYWFDENGIEDEQ